MTRSDSWDTRITTVVILAHKIWAHLWGSIVRFFLFRESALSYINRRRSFQKPNTLAVSLVCLFSTLAPAQQKPKLTLDEFFNYIGFSAVELSPDGNSVLINTIRADWDHSVFRNDLWLYRDTGQHTLMQLTQSGKDTDPQWSPDGKWIGFLSARKGPFAKEEDSRDETKQLYVIAASGGEAIALTRGDEEVHAFAWSPNSRVLYFATRTPWTKDQKEAYKKEWQDTIEYRDAERGDTIFSLDLASAVARNQEADGKLPEDPAKGSDATPGARAVATPPWHVDQMVTSPNGNTLAFVTTSVSQRQEKVEEFEIFAVDLTNPSAQQKPKQLTNNHAVEHDLRWSPDNRHIFFTVDVGDVTGPYRDLQPHLYWVDSATGQMQWWNQSFIGSIEHYAVSGNGVLVAARQGTEVPVSKATNASEALSKLNVWPGTYEILSTSPKSSRVSFVYSSLNRPQEVYIADSPENLANAHPITAFNQLFTERDLPQGKPYRWVADDGTPVEGMLMYPPGKFEQKGLPMFTFIHGGPASADGDHFNLSAGVICFQWDRLAATQGWLVFEPNYRGSTGYGDKFLLGMVPQIVSRPGKDILEGIDALVKDGIADPNHLGVGGYSYGGYMTNWLITQTNRFKVAVTGAGAVEHVANWGNDDVTFDDTYFLGGRPWEAAQRYGDEAAIFQINKVTVPTHIVAGANDIRVAVAENYLLDRALHSLGIPSSLLIFPGEGHRLANNPWHGKIKVREELKWLDKYAGINSK